MLKSLSFIFNIIIFNILLALPSVNAANEIPLIDFIKKDDYFDMKLSPNGKHMSAHVRVDGRVYVVFLDTATMKIVSSVSPQAGDELHSTYWVNNERVVYQLRENFSFSQSYSYINEPIATGELYGINIDGSNADQLYGYRAEEANYGSRIKRKEDTNATPQIISKLVDRNKDILIVEYPWSKRGQYWYDDRQKKSIISRLNTYTGKKKKIETLPYPGAEAFATEKGEVKFIRWTDDKALWQVAYREDKDAEWRPINIPEAQGHVPIDISKDGDKIYFKGAIGEAGFKTIYELDAIKGTYMPVFENLSASIAGYNWDPGLEKPVVGFTYPGKVAYAYAKGTSNTAATHKQLVGAFGGQEVSIVSESEGHMLVYVSGDVNPGEFYLFNTKTKAADFLWANRAWLDPRAMAAKQTITFKASDSLLIHGYITLPNNLSTKQKAPLVVMIHGGPHGYRDSSAFDGEVQLLANRGYAVLQVNYRGSGGYGSKFIRAGYKQWGGKMIQDIIEGTQYAVENYPIDQQRMCIYGASYGGYAALMASVRAPNTYKCTIGYVGIYDLNYAYSKTSITELLGGNAILEAYIGTDKAQLNEYSPVNHASKIKANVMLIHGEKDNVAPVINADVMKKRLQDAGKEVTYMNFNTSGHGVYDVEEQKTLYTALLAFLDKNIGE